MGASWYRNINTAYSIYGFFSYPPLPQPSAPSQVTAKLLYALFACTSFTFIGSEFGLKPYFLIWVCLILFAISGKFTIMPPVIARMYGNKYMSTNYGLLYTSQVRTLPV